MLCDGPVNRAREWPGPCCVQGEDRFWLQVMKDVGPLKMARSREAWGGAQPRRVWQEVHGCQGPENRGRARAPARKPECLATARLFPDPNLQTPQSQAWGCPGTLSGGQCLQLRGPSLEGPLKKHIGRARDGRGVWPCSSLFPAWDPQGWPSPRKAPSFTSGPAAAGTLESAALGHAVPARCRPAPPSTQPGLSPVSTAPSQGPRCPLPGTGSPVHPRQLSPCVWGVRWGKQPGDWPESGLEVSGQDRQPHPHLQPRLPQASRGLFPRSIKLGSGFGECGGAQGSVQTRGRLGQAGERGSRESRDTIRISLTF